MNTRALSIAGVLLACNLTLAKTASVVSLPLYLDSVGTLLAGALLPWPYVVGVAILTSAFGGLVIHPAFFFYAGTQLVIALLALFATRYGLLRRWWTSILTGVLIGLCAAIASAPITAIAFGGVTLSGTTAINAILLASGRGLWKAVITGALFIELLDKPAAALIACLVLRRLPDRFLQSKSRA